MECSHIPENVRFPNIVWKHKLNLMKNEEDISKLNGERVEGGKNMRSTINMIIIYFVKFQIIKK